MYVNVNILSNSSFSFEDVIYLQLIKQLRTEPEVLDSVQGIPKATLENFEEKEYITFIKGKKNDSKLSKIRITKKGSDFLDNLNTPEITDGDVKMFDYLCEMYLKSDDEERVIGNKKKTKKYISVFRSKIGLSLHEMYWLCWAFLKDYKYTKKLENIFFDSNKNRYGKFENNIEDSPLYQYLDENRKQIEKIWKLKIEGE